MTLTMVARALLGSSLAGLLLLSGCEFEPPEVKLEAKLTELREKRQTLIDKLYEGYGQGELAQAISDEADEGAKDAAAKKDSVGQEVLNALSRAAGEVDRAAFESHCSTLGKGERPAVLSDRGRAYFAKASTKKACKAIGKVDVHVEALEAKLKKVKRGES